MLAPAAAPAKSRGAKAKRPSITRVTPMRVSVGAMLTIRGRNFSRRRTRNTVIFRAPNGRSVFVKPTRASTRKLVVRVPVRRRPDHRRQGHPLQAARARRQVQLLHQEAPVAGARCRARRPSRAPSARPAPRRLRALTTSCAAGDVDGDLLSGALEAQIKTDPCLRDTDGDGIEDGYEYQSALDLNHYPATPPLPYPGKRPYPNALDPSDAFTDYDGDGLALRWEYTLWVRFSGDGAPRSGRPTTLSSLLYSDGLQRSRSVAAPGGTSLLDWALDADEDGILRDDERDGDGDGLGNWDEANGKLTEAWWPAKHDGDDQPKESKYPGINFLDNADLPQHDAYADADIDGDGVLDGADDADHDGLSNQFEVRRPGRLVHPGVRGPAGGLQPRVRTRGPTRTPSTPASPSTPSAATATPPSATTTRTRCRRSGRTRRPATRPAHPTTPNG